MGGGGDMTTPKGVTPEVVSKCAELGIDVRTPTHHPYLWVGEEFSKANVPNPWSEYSDEHGQVFYYDHQSGSSQWTHPLLETFKALLRKCLDEPGLLEYYKELFYHLRAYCDEQKGWWALNLLATPSGAPPPSPEEVRDMALYLQISLKNESELLWIAKQAVQVPLPPTWEEHEDSTGNVYFYDKTTGKSQLKHPLDDYFFALVSEERKKLPAKRRARRKDDLKVGWMPFLDDQGATFYVSFSRNISTYYPPWEPRFQKSAHKIQKKWRQKMAARYRIHNAAVTIQRVYRGHVVRDAVGAWRAECAALCIQTMYRMYRVRRSALVERATLSIQAFARMIKHRKAFLTHKAAVSIQCAWRGHRAFQLLKNEKAAAAIQRMYRCGKAREERERRARESKAAKEIQRRVRGIQGRQYARDYRQHQAATKIQTVQRGRIAKRRVAEERVLQEQNRAATKIQTVARQKLARNEVARRELLNRQGASALIIQSAYRGYEARQYVAWIKMSAAARTIQKHYRPWAVERRKVTDAAATVIQRFYRGYKAREWVDFIKQNAADQIHNAAAKIQSTFRGFHYRKTTAERNAAVAIQRMVKGKAQRQRYILQRAAIRIQKNWKGAKQRRETSEMRRHMLYIALRMQCMFRVFISKRNAQVGRMMFEYEWEMAARVQAAWKGSRARIAFKAAIALHKRRAEAAVQIQSTVRGFAARKELRLWHATAIRVQAAVRSWRAKAMLALLKKIAQKRALLLTALRPLYEALCQLPQSAPGPRRDRLVDQYILRDTLSGRDQVCQEALETLKARLEQLHSSCLQRADQRELGMAAMSISWRLLNIPRERWITLPEEGAAAWLSDNVMRKMAAEIERLQKLKREALPQLIGEARTWVTNLWDELAAQPSWREQCQAMASPEATEEVLEGILAQVSIMEKVKPMIIPCVGLIKRSRELAGIRAAMPSAEELLNDRGRGAVTRRKQSEATRAMLGLEEPRVSRELAAVLTELKNSLPPHSSINMPYLQQIFGFASLEELKAQIDAEAAARQEALSKRRFSSIGAMKKVVNASKASMSALNAISESKMNNQDQGKGEGPASNSLAAESGGQKSVRRRASSIKRPSMMIINGDQNQSATRSEKPSPREAEAGQDGAEPGEARRPRRRKKKGGVTTEGAEQAEG